MIFDPLFNWMVPFFGWLCDRINVATTKPLPPQSNTIHPEPHRNPVTGKIVIENNKLYYEDLEKYGAYQAQQWVKQGKYNLSPEEFKKEKERIKAKYDYLYRLKK